MSEAARKTRVLVVDDSVVMRRLLAEAISSDPELEVAGYAANGQIAMALLDRLAPDVITLDVEMPVMNGLSTLKAIRAAGRGLPIIMFSTLTNRGAEATIDVLALARAITLPSRLARAAMTPRESAFARLWCQGSKRFAGDRRPRRQASKPRASASGRFSTSSQRKPSKSWALDARLGDRTRWRNCCPPSPLIFPHQS